MSTVPVRDVFSPELIEAIERLHTASDYGPYMAAVHDIWSITKVMTKRESAQ
jgi:hypothetical protein